MHELAFATPKTGDRERVETSLSDVASQRLKVGRGLPLLVALLLVAPSPALTAGTPAGFLAPTILVLLTIQSWRRATRLRPRTKSGVKAIELHLQLIALSGIVFVLAALVEPSDDRIARAIGRLLIAATIIAMARLYAMEDGDARRRLNLGIVAGATVAAIVAIVASATQTEILGQPLLPGRSFILPFDLPKTTGIPRSFGEAGLILGAGVAFASRIQTSTYRLGALLILSAGILVGQSRNMIAVLVVVLLVSLVGRRLRPLGPLASTIALAALFSPVVVSVTLDQSTYVQETFVGEGIYARNVDARLSLLDEFARVESEYQISRRPFGATRIEWVDLVGIAPHNHFVSLLALDGLSGLAILTFWFVIPALRSARLKAGLAAPEFSAFIGSVVALSFYEGAFSGPAALMTAFLLGASVDNQQTEIPTSSNRPPHTAAGAKT